MLSARRWMQKGWEGSPPPSYVTPLAHALLSSSWLASEPKQCTDTRTMEEPTPSKVSALAALKARRTQSSNLAQPPQQQQLEAAVGQQDPVQARPKTKGSKTVQAHSWVCTMCQQECIPIRTESRCLCGHRMKEHDKPGESAGGKCRQVEAEQHSAAAADHGFKAIDGLETCRGGA